VAVLFATPQPAKHIETPHYLGQLVGGLAHVALVMWPFWLLLGGAALVKLLYEEHERRRLARSGIADVDAMDGRTFEVFLSTLFQREGYDTKLTRYRGDYGADLVIERGGVRTAVQAKCWKKNVGIKAVQEAVAAGAMYDCSRALVVANREFTAQARALAQANGVELWGREVLVGKLLSVRAPSEALRAETADACIVCGSLVSAKVRDWCTDHPERFHGQIYCYHHQRGARGRASVHTSV
jgi:restriction system protein